MNTEWFHALLIAVTSVGSASVALLLTSLAPMRRSHLPAVSIRPQLEPAIFLFDDQKLVDATGPARSLLATVPTGGSDWARLSSFLAPRFTELAARMATLNQLGRIELTATAGAAGPPLRLIAEDVEGLARITVIDPEAEGTGVLIDALSLRAMEDEVELLRGALDNIPAPIWREAPDGIVTWANRAYILRCGALREGEDGLIWPLPRLFTLEGHSPTPRRISLATAPDAMLWFDCHSFVLSGDLLHVAFPADAAVRAEKSRTEFIQTLSKTFADLPIGLAVFDRKRQLQLFNPALTELTLLSTEFLSARPTLFAFLDHLRETRMIPEPRDYRSWRQQMTELEKAAAAGFHSETWTLPGGRTYRVTGRPHPHGAVAFLIEDISSEVSLTRRFRDEIELGQEVLDAIEDPVCVFQSSGELLLANAACERLWNHDGTLPVRLTIHDAIAAWQRHFGPNPAWQQIGLQCLCGTVREATSGQIPLREGELTYRLTAVRGGAAMLRLSVRPGTQPPARDEPRQVEVLAGR